MNQNLRMSITIVLCAVIYFVWLNWFAPKPVTKLNGPTNVVSAIENQPVETTPSTIEVLPDTTAETSGVAQTLVLQTPKAKFTIDTQGAKLVSAIFDDFKTTADNDAAPKDFLTQTPDSNALALRIDGYAKPLDKKIFDVVSHDQNQVVLTWQDDKLRIQKKFLISQTAPNYALDVSYEITNLTAEELELAPYWQSQVTQKIIEKPSGILGFFAGRSTQSEEFLPQYFYKKTLKTIHDWSKLTTIESPSEWSAITDRYFFLALAMPTTTSEPAKTVFTRDNNRLVFKTFAPKQIVPAGQSLSGTAKAYLGPKKTSELKLLQAGLENAIDYGWFGFLAGPMLWLMQTLHGMIPSWGLAIILLTFIVKILLYPINKKSMASMKAMQQLQPKLEEIRKKFPNDKQKQNEEVMQLFRTHKVNPVGGCLPMLLQLPIYFALYRVLWNAIELYHTPFLHYKDLSAPDPHFIAPIIMGVFMFLQQQLTPNPSTDPSQKKMMMFMPIFFTAIMLFLPVGLVIYICINTSMSVAQQYMMRKDISLRDLVFGRFRQKT